VLAGQFVYLLNNGPDTDFDISNGANNVMIPNQRMPLLSCFVTCTAVACNSL
jgi:hypothetical protein